MKLRQIGMNHTPICTGIILTPSEYKQHEAYRQFRQISSPTLFITYAPNPAHSPAGWAAVSTKHASNLAILEATTDEEAAMVAAGYRMLNLENAKTGVTNVYHD